MADCNGQACARLEEQERALAVIFRPLSRVLTESCRNRLAVITAVLAGVALSLVIGLQTFGVLANMFHCIDPTMAVEQRETIMSESIIRLITMIDGYLLGAFMLIFGFGLYELFVPQIQEAKASRMSARILRVESLEDLKSRLGKVILIILIVETFKDGFQIRNSESLGCPLCGCRHRPDRAGALSYSLFLI